MFVRNQHTLYADVHHHHHKSPPLDPLCGECSESVSDVMCHFVSEFCKHVLLLTHCSSPLSLLQPFTSITIAVLGQRYKLWRFSLCNLSSLFIFCVSQLQHSQCCCCTLHDSVMALHVPVNYTTFCGSLICASVSLL